MTSHLTTGLAEQVKNPGKSYPIGLLLSVVISLLTYLLPIMGGVLVLPYDQWTDSALKVRSTFVLSLLEED
jgi:amino acid transporter